MIKYILVYNRFFFFNISWILTYFYSFSANTTNLVFYCMKKLITFYFKLFRTVVSAITTVEILTVQQASRGVILTDKIKFLNPAKSTFVVITFVFSLFNIKYAFLIK